MGRSVCLNKGFVADRTEVNEKKSQLILRALPRYDPASCAIVSAVCNAVIMSSSAPDITLWSG